MNPAESVSEILLYYNRLVEDLQRQLAECKSHQRNFTMESNQRGEPSETELQDSLSRKAAEFKLPPRDWVEVKVKE